LSERFQVSPAVFRQPSRANILWFVYHLFSMYGGNCGDG
jgi:hypothetical protein